MQKMVWDGNILEIYGFSSHCFLDDFVSRSELFHRRSSAKLQWWENHHHQRPRTTHTSPLQHLRVRKNALVAGLSLVALVAWWPFRSYEYIYSQKMGIFQKLQGGNQKKQLVEGINKDRYSGWKNKKLKKNGLPIPRRSRGKLQTGEKLSFSWEQNLDTQNVGAQIIKTLQTVQLVQPVGHRHMCFSRIAKESSKQPYSEWTIGLYVLFSVCFTKFDYSEESWLPSLRFVNFCTQNAQTKAESDVRETWDAKAFPGCQLASNIFSLSLQSPLLRI